MEAWEIKSHGKEGDNFRRISGKRQYWNIERGNGWDVPQTDEIKQIQKIYLTQGSNPSSALQADSLPSELPGKPMLNLKKVK